MASVSGAVLLALAAFALARGGELAQQTFAALIAAQPYAPLLVTPLTFVVVVWLTERFCQPAKGSGIPQVIAAAHSAGGGTGSSLLSLPVAAFKFGATLVMLAAGAAVGREGPTVQVSAAIMQATHRWLRVPISAGVVIAGGAAGVAAAFNTPLAGISFAIEELASAYEQRVAVLVMGAVMLAGLVSLGIAGDYVYFGAMRETMKLSAMVVTAPLAGVVGGLLGGLFSRALVMMAWSRKGLVARMRSRPVVLAGVCGLVVASLGLATGGLTWGTGYETTRAMLIGEHGPLLIGPARLIATLATAISGVPGGIFAPSLSVGAGLGQFLTLLFPDQSAGAVVLLGMAGYFTGVVRAPLTSVIIMTEMTEGRSMILPLFATAMIADWVSSKVCKQKLYHALARRFDD